MNFPCEISIFSISVVLNFDHASIEHSKAGMIIASHIFNDIWGGINPTLYQSPDRLIVLSSQFLKMLVEISFFIYPYSYSFATKYLQKICSEATTRGLLWKSGSSKFHNNCTKTLALESVFNKVEDLWTWRFIEKRLQHKCFSMIIAKFLRTLILKNICKRLFIATR